MNISALGYVVIGTTDFARWHHFGTEILGMQAISGEENRLYLKMDERHHRYLILPHDTDKVLASGWEMANQDDYDTAISTLSDAGLHLQPASEEEKAMRWVQDYFSVTDPSGNNIEVFWGPKGDFSRMNSPIGVKGFVTGDLGMGHIVLPSTNFDASIKFWVDVMGLGLSDFIHYDMGADQDLVRINFLHCNNARQHSLALVEMDNPAGCDHLLVEVQDFDEVGRGLYRAEDNNIDLQVTLGRHINDDMVSFYMYSPGGFAIEYGAGGKRIEDWATHQVFEATQGSHWGHRFVAGSRPIE